MLNIDFLPERIKLQRAHRKRLIRQGYLLVSCVVALGVLAYARYGRVKSAQAELLLLTERSANVRQQLVMRGSLERQQGELAVKKRIDDQLGSRINVLDILAELSRLLPESMSITKFRFEAMEVPQAVKSACGGEHSGGLRTAGRSRPKFRMVKRILLIINGLAPNDVDVANFIGLLSACPLFEDVHMGYAKTLEFRGQESREFQAKCYVVR